LVTYMLATSYAHIDFKAETTRLLNAFRQYHL
jgi:hypothetical protein